MSSAAILGETAALVPVGSSIGGTFEPREGLSSAEAAGRLKAYGPNALEPPPRETFLSILLVQTRSVIFLLTIFASLISRALGEKNKAVILLSVVVIVALVNTIGEWSGQDAGAALARMSSASARVLRDGQEKMIDAREIVVGDVLSLKMGDMVPADLVVLDSIDLRSNESVLTGEPHEIMKTVVPKDPKVPFPSNVLYNMTSVVGGHGTGEVVATGMQTQVGLIAKRLKSEVGKKLNPLQESINLLGSAVAIAVLCSAFIATSVAYVTKYQNPLKPCMTDDKWCLFEASLLRGIVMSIALIPHGLPFVVMVMMKVGASEMAKRNGVVTKVTAVDYLAATTVICTDKTGTLTEGRMAAQAVIGLCREDDDSEPLESTLAFYPLRGLSPNGGVFDEKQLDDKARQRMDAIFDAKQKRQVFTQHDVPDFGQLDKAVLDDKGRDALFVRAQLACGLVSSYGTSIFWEAKSGRWESNGNMTEAALKVAAAKGGYWDEEGRGFDLHVNNARLPELEVPFSSKRKMMATVHSLQPGGLFETLRFPATSTHFAIVKGAPDRILSSLTHSLKVGDGALVTSECLLSDVDRKMLEERNKGLARKALRSLLVAVRPITDAEVQAMRKASDADERLAILVGSSLCFLGLWGIYDPPRASVPASVQECHAAGIRVVMITGDQRTTAAAIGQHIGVMKLGDDEDRMTATCELLHTHKPPAFSNSSRLSKRASQLLMPLIQGDRQVDDPMKRLHSFRGSRRLSVHDTRSARDQHEPEYKSEEELVESTSRVNIWARAAPTDKVAIVEALSRQGHLVAMTGDGVNDAPALKRASVGVSMGIAGTEVTKNAADLVLMDDDFSTIVAAIREGRKIYLNTQKYVVTNLSLKGGECLSLLCAIGIGLPMPIQPLPQMLNLLCTHILCTLPFAWEEAEDYIMRVPPRQTKRDFVVSQTMWFFRWLPFVVSFGLVALSSVSLGVWMHTGFVFSHSLVPSSHPREVQQGLVACERAGRLENGGYVPDMQPFHCTCAVREGMPWAEATLVDQWGPGADYLEAMPQFDRWTGQVPLLFDKGNTPWKHGFENLLQPCQGSDGVEHWCWKDGAPSDLPVLPQAQNCAAYGSRIGQSMAYVTVQLGEILTIFSFRRDAFLLPSFFTNARFNCALLLNLTMLCSFLYVPFLSSVVDFAPLKASCLVVACLFVAVLVFVTELFKHVYRQKLFSINRALETEALRRSEECIPPLAWDALAIIPEDDEKATVKHGDIV